MEVFDETTDNVVVGKVTGHVKKGLTREVVDGSVDGDFGLLQEKDGRHEVATGDFGKVGDGGRRDEIFGGVVCFVVGVVFVGGGCGNDVFGVGVFVVGVFIVSV